MLSDPQFELLNGRTVEVLKNHSEDIDPAMLPILNAISDMDWLTTVWCCSGHEDENYSLPYLTLVVKPEHEGNACTLLGYVGKIADKYEYVDITAEIGKLHSSWEGINNYREITLRWRRDNYGAYQSPNRGCKHAFKESRESLKELQILLEAVTL